MPHYCNPLFVAQDGRLQCGDHILMIGNVSLRGLGSDQVASVLRQSGNHVRLIVARPVDQPYDPNAQPVRLLLVSATLSLSWARVLENFILMLQFNHTQSQKLIGLLNEGEFVNMQSCVPTYKLSFSYFENLSVRCEWWVYIGRNFIFISMGDWNNRFGQCYIIGN